MTLLQVAVIVLASSILLLVNLYIIFSCRGRDELGLPPSGVAPDGEQ
jgi:hypothetical protein